MNFSILGDPRTKKNHTRIIRVRGVPRIVQAESHDAWAQSAQLQLQAQWSAQRPRGMGDGLPDDNPKNLRALVYRDRAVGDLGNYLAAICDVLERAGVVANDRLIAGFDGSRLLVDRANPRVEITLTEMA